MNVTKTTMLPIGKSKIPPNLFGAIYQNEREDINLTKESIVTTQQK